MQSYYKLCRRCHVRKLVEEFQPKVLTSGRLGWRHICTECKNAEGRESTIIPEANRNRRNIRLKSRYGITLKEYEELEAYQEYVCAICKKEYTVNKAETWNRCTPEHCHECTLRLDSARLETY